MAKLAHEQLDPEALQHRLTHTRREHQGVGSSARLAVDEPRPLTPAVMLHMQRTVGNRDMAKLVTPAMILHMQRTVGNRAVAGLLSSRARPAPTTPVQQAWGELRGEGARRAPEGPDIDALAVQRLPHDGDLVIQRWQWPWEEEEGTDEGGAGGAGGAPPQGEPTGSEGGAEGAGPGTDPDAGSDYVGGGGESGGGGSSYSYDTDEGGDREILKGWECTISCYLVDKTKNHKCTVQPPYTSPKTAHGSSKEIAYDAAKKETMEANPDKENCRTKHCDPPTEGEYCKKV